MKLVWTSTGDTLSIGVEDSKVIDYWFGQIKLSDANSFQLIHSGIPNSHQFDELRTNLEFVNNILAKFKIDPLMDHTADWVNQDNLNLLHEKWVKLHHKHKIIELLSKFPNDAVRKFNDINSLIHKIESPAQVSYINDTKTVWQTTNPFNPDILKFGRWQVELHYQNLGRSTYEKWANFDNNLVDTDTNNFTQLGGEVCFNLGRPYSTPAPYEYVKFCYDNDVKPYGNKLPIGNFNESITTIKHVFIKNVGIENNRISFTL